MAEDPQPDGAETCASVGETVRKALLMKEIKEAEERAALIVEVFSKVTPPPQPPAAPGASEGEITRE